MQLTKVKGVFRTMLIELSIERIDIAKKLVFPDIVVNTSSENAVQRIKEGTKGRGADRIMASCSNEKVQGESISMIVPCGIINFYGGYH